jgi:hypothetical protein
MSDAELNMRITRLEAKLAELATRERVATVSPWTPISGGVVYVDASGTGALTTEAAFTYDDTNNELIVGRARLTEQATPSTPVNPYAILFANSTGTLSGVDDAGVVRQMIRYADTTWTPVFAGTGGGGSFTYSYQTGEYIRRENVIEFWGHVRINTFTSAPAGNLIITGLPTASRNTTNQFYAAILGYRSAALTTIDTVSVPINSTQINCYTTGGALVAASVLAAGAEIVVGGSYPLP